MEKPQSPTLEPSSSPAPSRSDIREIALSIFCKRTAILLMLAFLCANFVSTIFMTWTATFLVEKFHFTLSAAGFSGTAFILMACAVGSPTGGIIADRLCGKILGGRVLVQASGLLFASLFVFLIGTTTHVSTLLMSMICFGFGKGLYDSNIFASIYDVVDARARSTAAGLMNTIGWGGGALGPLAVGWIAKHGHGTELQNMSRAIASTGLVYILSTILLLLVPMYAIRRDMLATRR